MNSIALPEFICPKTAIILPETLNNESADKSGLFLVRPIVLPKENKTIERLTRKSRSEVHVVFSR